jgi:hypothetical protein
MPFTVAELWFLDIAVGEKYRMFFFLIITRFIWSMHVYSSLFTGLLLIAHRCFCGYVHVYKIIKQLFHACSGNLRPHATVLKSSPAPRDNSFDCSLNRHEITVYYLIMVFFRRNWSYLPTRGPPEPVSLIWLFMHCLSISKLVISQHQQKHSVIITRFIWSMHVYSSLFTGLLLIAHRC